MTAALWMSFSRAQEETKADIQGCGLAATWQTHVQLGLLVSAAISLQFQTCPPASAAPGWFLTGNWDNPLFEVSSLEFLSVSSQSGPALSRIPGWEHGLLTPFSFQGLEGKRSLARNVSCLLMLGSDFFQKRTEERRVIRKIVYSTYFETLVITGLSKIKHGGFQLLF
jgi:hypothetical protein